MNIGVFDSGLGGLTILKKLLQELPQYNYVYLGDNARVPYGNRSPELIYDFTKQAMNFLMEKNCKLVIIACNTSTATSLKKIQHEYLPKHYPDRRVLGVIKPTIETISEKNHTKIGIVGTKATVNSGAFVREIKKVLPEAVIYQQACPLLVPFIEDGSKSDAILNLILKEYLSGLIKKKINTLVLACTHYELIKNQIKRIVGSKIKVLTEGHIVAEKLKDYLANHYEIENKLDKNGEVKYFVTDLNPDYQQLMAIFLGKKFSNKDVHLVKIDV